MKKNTKVAIVCEIVLSLIFWCNTIIKTVLSIIDIYLMYLLFFLAPIKSLAKADILSCWVGTDLLRPIREREVDTERKSHTCLFRIFGSSALDTTLKSKNYYYPAQICISKSETVFLFNIILKARTHTSTFAGSVLESFKCIRYTLAQLLLYTDTYEHGLPHVHCVLVFP